MEKPGVLRIFRTAILQSLAGEVLDTAKATAYSGMLMLFPAFLVLTTLLAVIPAGNTLLDELRIGSEHFLPADTMSLLQSFFETRRAFSMQVLLSASGLSFLAAWGVMSSLMAGFSRAYRLPRSRHRIISWSQWHQRIRALLLVPIAVVPLSLASAVIVFGQPIEVWMVANSDHSLRPFVLLFWRLVRWALAVLTSATVLGAVYHFGTNSKETWRRVIPGALTATLLWFPVTLAFGVYVTRLADYSIVYGSLGTAIATLVWLYLTSYSVLLGAQLNGVLFRERRREMIRSKAAIRKGEKVANADATLPASSASAVPIGTGEIVLTDDPELPKSLSQHGA